MPSADFSLLLDYYNAEYRTFPYVQAATLDSENMLGDQLLKTFNIVCKFVSLSLFHSRYKSCGSNVNGHRGSHVLAFSKAKRCLAPPRINTSLGIVLLCWTTIKMCRWFHTPLPWSNGTSLQEILCRPSNLPKNPLTCCVQWILSCHLQTASSLCFTSILQLLSSTIILTT